MGNRFLAMGALFGALGVALGAFAAHALRDAVTPDLLANFETGARYHLIHAVALAGVGIGSDKLRIPAWVGWAFVAGIVIFSGSLYLMAISGQRWLGAITPIGGVSFIAAWLGLAWTAWRGAR